MGIVSESIPHHNSLILRGLYARQGTEQATIRWISISPPTSFSLRPLGASEEVLLAPCWNRSGRPWRSCQAKSASWAEEMQPCSIFPLSAIGPDKTTRTTPRVNRHRACPTPKAGGEELHHDPPRSAESHARRPTRSAADRRTNCSRDSAPEQHKPWPSSQPTISRRTRPLSPCTTRDWCWRTRTVSRACPRPRRTWRVRPTNSPSRHRGSATCRRFARPAPSCPAEPARYTRASELPARRCPLVLRPQAAAAHLEPRLRRLDPAGRRSRGGRSEPPATPAARPSRPTLHHTRSRVAVRPPLMTTVATRRTHADGPAETRFPKLLENQNRGS